MKIIKEELEIFIKDNPDMTQKEVAAFFGVTVSAISYALKRYNIPWDNKKRKINIAISKEDLEKYLMEHPDEYLFQISENLGLSENKLKRYISMYGIEFKDPKKIAGKRSVTPKEKLIERTIQLLLSNPKFTIYDVEDFLKTKKNINVPVGRLLLEEEKRFRQEGKEKEADKISKLLNRGSSIDER